MSSPYQCSPPFHLDPGDTRAQATSFYLVSSPAALENCGIYTSWGAPPSSPPERPASLCGMPAATPGSMPTLRAPPSLTVLMLSATGATFSVHRFAHANLCRAPPHPLDQEGSAAWGEATLCAPDNPRVATHVAAGHTLEEARALVCLRNLEGQILKEEYAYDSTNKYWHDS
ncbi:hypothetical protein K438DRAFT_1771385 [Mycena galopus ATCC 62051]|nr:hypothetical protein K438DRAFT_1771385 [Mycena galopus ATCC 62051]